MGKYRSLGVYAVSGPNWTQDLQTICDNSSKEACDEARLLGEYGVPISVKNLEYLKQLSETQRYQVYATPFDYINNSTQPLIEGKKYDDYVPVNPVPVSDADTED